MDESRESLGRWTAAVVLSVAAFTLCFYHYDIGDLHRTTEAQIGVFARRMNAMGSWLTPYLDGRPQPATPPLYLWMVKLLSGLSPEVPSYTVRLPAAACSFLMALLVAAWLFRQAGRYGRDDGVEPPPEGFGLLAGLMFVSMPLLFWAGRPASANSLFALAFLAASFCWAESLEARRSYYSGWPWRRWLFTGYVVAGVGMLAGGPLILLMLWIPYLLAARSYRLHGPDWIHVVGALAALALGGWWPWLVMHLHPGDPAVANVWRDWLGLRTGQAIMLRWSTGDFLRNLLIGTLPWSLPALVMVVRIWRREERSPTLVFWMWSLAANLVLLTVVNGRAGSHPLPLAALTALLATDAIYRWNFETGRSQVGRTVLRLLLILSLPPAMFVCGILNSDLGMALFILLALGWAHWALRSHFQGITFTPWTTTVRLTSIAVVLMLAMEVTLLSDWLPRIRYHDASLAYFARVKNRLSDPAPRLYLLDDRRSALHDYYLGDQVRLIDDLNQIVAPEQQATYLFARRDLEQVDGTLWLAPLTRQGGACGDPPREIMYRVLAPSKRSEIRTPIDRLNHRLPFRLALLGNTGTRHGAQRDVADALHDESKRGLIDDIVLLGNNIWGPSVFDHLDIVDSFEIPYRRLLRDGVRFHAALGHEDQSYGWLQTRYPAFNMCGRRYYRRTLGMGLIDLFILDSETLYRMGQFDLRQLGWLERELEASRAPWKVVGLNGALFSDAGKGKAEETLAEQLIPLFNRYQVDVVAWAGGHWYERLELPESHPMFLNLGWSGDVTGAQFQNTPILQASRDDRAGFFFIDFTVNSMNFRAVDMKGNVVDIGHVSKGGGPPQAYPIELPVEEPVGRTLPTPTPGTAGPRAGATPTPPAAAAATPLSTATPMPTVTPEPTPPPKTTPAPKPSPSPAPTPASAAEGDGPTTRSAGRD